MCHLIYTIDNNANSFELLHMVNEKCTAKPAEGKSTPK
jgi:hypothetical protein